MEEKPDPSHRHFSRNKCRVSSCQMPFKSKIPPCSSLFLCEWPTSFLNWSLISTLLCSQTSSLSGYFLGLCSEDASFSEGKGRALPSDQCHLVCLAGSEQGEPRRSTQPLPSRNLISKEPLPEGRPLSGQRQCFLSKAGSLLSSGLEDPPLLKHSP